MNGTYPRSRDERGAGGSAAWRPSNPGTLLKSHPITRPRTHGVALPSHNISDTPKASTNRAPSLVEPAKWTSKARPRIYPANEGPPRRPDVCCAKPLSYPSPAKVEGLVWKGKGDINQVPSSFVGNRLEIRLGGGGAGSRAGRRVSNDFGSSAGGVLRRVMIVLRRWR